MAVSAKDITPKQSEISRQVSRSLSFSTSPAPAFPSPPSSYPAQYLTRAVSTSFPKLLKPFATEDIRILLLENVNQTGRDILLEQGYQVEFEKSSLLEDQLIEKIRFVYASSTRRLPASG
jgi:D-3-phosphoglycerate dehydrogenase